MDELFPHPTNWNKYFPVSPIPIIPTNPITSTIPTIAPGGGGGTAAATGPILETSHIFWMIIDSTLMLIILSGNILTICAVHFNRKLSRTIANQFIINLAISDCFVGLTLPYHLIFYLDNNTFSQHKSTCLLRFVLITMACSASIYNLIAIALDRYIAIVYPLHYNRYMTKRVYVLIIICGWVLSTTVSTLPVYWNRWDEAVQHQHQQPIECELHIIIPKHYVTFVMVPYFAIVWATLFILYVRIWREAVHHAKRLRSTTNYYQNNGFHKRDWKSIQVVLLVLGCFSICWLPYLIVACFEVTQNSEKLSNNSTTTYKTVFSLAMINSGMNPIIYAWKNTGFRTSFKRLLHCQNPDFADYNPSYRNQYVRNNNLTTINNQKIQTITTSDNNNLSRMSTVTLSLPTMVVTTTSGAATLNSDCPQVTASDSDKNNCDIEQEDNNGSKPSDTELVLYANGLKHNNSTITILTTTESDLEETVA